SLPESKLLKEMLPEPTLVKEMQSDPTLLKEMPRKVRDFSSSSRDVVLLMLQLQLSSALLAVSSCFSMAAYVLCTAISACKRASSSPMSGIDGVQEAAWVQMQAAFSGMSRGRFVPVEQMREPAPRARRRRRKRSASKRRHIHHHHHHHHYSHDQYSHDPQQQ
ncbi:MAG: hypothetical protein SGCHY_003782, partial [Lobulomycetales sp.]